MTHTHLPRVAVAKLILVDVAHGSEDRALVEHVALLDCDLGGCNGGGFSLALRSARIHGVADPAVAAELVADGDLACVRVAEALVLGGAVAAEDGAFVEFVALVEEGGGVGGREGEAEEARDGEDSELHFDDCVVVV
jgi:hypothetical protein